MDKKTKLTLMFLPLGLLLLGVGVVSADLKNPVASTQYDCEIVGTGQEAAPLKSPGKMLYDNGAKPLYDIAFRCNELGTVWVNDPEAFKQSVLEAGQPATIFQKTYHYWPETWRIEVRTSSK